MAEVTAPLALDETLQQVVSKLGNISSVAGASAYTQAVAGGYTGTQAEFEAQIAKQPIVVNPNLLDNWYFIGGGSQQGNGQLPINQRGQTSYTGAVNGIDRWENNGSGTVAISSSGIVVSASSSATAFFGQKIENPVPDGTVCTFSALSSDGTLYKATSAMSSASQWNCAFGHANGSGRVEYSNFALLTASAGKTATWVAVKLELGDTQTLAHNEGTEENPVWVLNEIPNYTEELWKCQRYYQLFASSSYRPTYGEDCRPPMRLHSPTKGTISIGGTTYYYANANL